jgi:FemAB-related protein (PEP-CTERM system-associated)
MSAQTADRASFLRRMGRRLPGQMLLAQLWRYARGEGVVSMARRAVLTVTSLAVSRPHSLVYALELTKAGAARGDERLEELRDAERDILGTIMYHSAAEIRRRFARGDRCFVRREGGAVAHYEWISFDRIRLDSIGRTLPLGPREAYIYNVRTQRPFRGRGLFTAALDTLSSRLQKEGVRRLWIATEAGNVASQRAILAAGFRLAHDIRPTRALGIRLCERWHTHPSSGVRRHGAAAIRLCTPDDPVWRAFAEDSPLATAFHDPRWARIFAATTDASIACALVAERLGRPVGALPLTLVTSRLAGRALVSQPFYMGGLACDDAEAANALLSESVALAGELAADYVEIREQQPTACDASSLGFQRVQRKSTFLLDLAPGESSLWKSFRKQVRNRVRRAERSGITVSRGADDASLRAFYRLMVASMHRLGSPVYGPEFFEQVVREFPTQTEVFVARCDDRPVAAKLALRDKDQLHLLWGAIDERFRREGANYLLTWSVVRYAIEQGLSTVNFGRSTTGSGAASFKAQWLTTEVPLTWWSRALAGTAAPQLHSEAKRWQRARACWRRMPRALTAWLGPRIARQIP